LGCGKKEELSTQGQAKSQPKPEAKAADQKPGTVIWEFQTESKFEESSNGLSSSPALGADGIVYVGALDDKVYALDGKSGAKKWEFVTKGSGLSSPAIGADGTVYVGSSAGAVYALDWSSGAKKWEFKIYANIKSSPAIGADGTIFVGSWDKKVYALNPDGTKKWEFETGSRVEASPTIGVDGTLYVNSGKKIYALKIDSQGPAKSPWAMFGQNAQRTGRDSNAKMPVKIPQGKLMAWTASVDVKSIDRIYPGKTQAVVQQVFGKPDKTQGEWWGYTGMNITDAQGNKYSTAWFGFSNGMVQQVRFDQ
jgi:hypothetical protein